MQPTDSELAELYDRYADVLHHRARSILGSDEAAWDAVHETFARVIRHWDRFRGESSPLTWMYRITTNWCLNQLRNRTGRERKHQQFRMDIVGEEATWQRHEAEAETVRRLLATADEETRRIVLHTYFDDMTRQQVAHEVGLSVPTVRKRLTQFYARARAILETPGALPPLDRAAVLVAAAATLAAWDALRGGSL